MAKHAVAIAGGGPTGLMVPLDISDFPTRHNYGLALWQNHIERILADGVRELAVPIYRGREGTDFAQDDTGVDVELGGGGSLRARYLVGCVLIRPDGHVAWVADGTDQGLRDALTNLVRMLEFLAR